MAKHGVLMERDNFIASKSINRAGISAIAIDGGCPVAEGAIVTANDELYTLTAFATGTPRVGVAFNPSRPLDEFGYPVRSMDTRTYTNRIGDVVEYFFPEIGMEFGVQMANITGVTAPVVGKFLECTNGTLLYTIKDTQTASVPSFEVVQIMSENYPTGDFSTDKEPVYIVKTRFNG